MKSSNVFVVDTDDCAVLGLFLEDDCNGDMEDAPQALATCSERGETGGGFTDSQPLSPDFNYSLVATV